MRQGRPPLRGGGRRQRQFRRQAYTVAFKLQVLRHFDSTKRMRATFDRFFDSISETKKSNKAKLVYK
ncbi:hypothetical protein PC129_g24065 [Phytophthora cactorum]|uniref:Uncharacterized protein n=1 Tax=Phytophthora cactorum TaxID=29920 RepID=A0A8T1JNF5_9STRA|nr:hypothetical protein Pcac1_g28008 [Phytophthora cactorum]KAG2763953.1 hypothetical protein Pcac1_g24409 [Phytophthora cactorum]KAG2791631.1 hypothetical protein PC111_g23834 [Phytophthora cactorum]KAG2793114.1 hypothetical protein PC112_g23583 [Phytophthora cactorum]KAG2814601.1 hypothetical protein PC113_g23298 [Phytophthora cactorum]